MIGTEIQTVSGTDAKDECDYPIDNEGRKSESVADVFSEPESRRLQSSLD
jgi:hypothetical protein